jgi:hypothetical protein
MILSRRKNKQRMPANDNNLPVGMPTFVVNIENESKISLSENAKRLLQSIPPATTSVFFSSHDQKIHALSDSHANMVIQYPFSSASEVIGTLDELTDCDYLEKNAPSQKIKSYTLTKKGRNFLRSQ